MGNQSTGVSVRLDVSVQGLGPVFKIVLTAVNVGTKPLFDACAMFGAGLSHPTRSASLTDCPYPYQKGLLPLTVCPYIAIYKTDTYFYNLEVSVTYDGPASSPLGKNFYVTRTASAWDRWFGVHC